MWAPVTNNEHDSFCDQQAVRVIDDNHTFFTEHTQNNSGSTIVLSKNAVKFDEKTWCSKWHWTFAAVCQKCQKRKLSSTAFSTFLTIRLNNHTDNMGKNQQWTATILTFEHSYKQAESSTAFLKHCAKERDRKKQTNGRKRERKEFQKKVIQLN